MISPGSGSSKFRIRPDLDPLNWLYVIVQYYRYRTCYCRGLFSNVPLHILFQYPMRMRSSWVVKASVCQCRSRNKIEYLKTPLKIYSFFNSIMSVSHVPSGYHVSMCSDVTCYTDVTPVPDMHNLIGSNVLLQERGKLNQNFHNVEDYTSVYSMFHKILVPGRPITRRKSGLSSNKNTRFSTGYTKSLTLFSLWLPVYFRKIAAHSTTPNIFVQTLILRDDAKSEQKKHDWCILRVRRHILPPFFLTKTKAGK